MQGLLLLVCGVNDVMGRNQPGREVEKAEIVWNVGFSQVLSMLKQKQGILYENKLKRKISKGSDCIIFTDQSDHIICNDHTVSHFGINQTFSYLMIIQTIAYVMINHSV